MNEQQLQHYMKLAIQEAHGMSDKGGVAIGAVLINEQGEVIGRGGSMVGLAHDPTAHAEVNCIREAAARKGSDDLFGSTLFSTLEPCHMCLSAAAWARIATVYFGAYRKDVDASLFDVAGISDEDEAKKMNLRENVEMFVQGGICRSECAALLAGYHEQHRHTA
jgi:tRNA(adenine34) deaminase